jgi:hypothetical protein
LKVNNQNLKFKGNDINDEGCEILNEILLENKSIEKINLNSNFLKNNKR